jgi:hypothetical protein
VTASFSGHNVWCDESGTTGKSDAIKKLLYRKCIALRERRLAKFDPDSAPDNGESTRSVKAYWTLRRDMRKDKERGSGKVIRVVIPLIT